MSIPQPSPFQAQRDKRQHIYISDFLGLGDFSPHSSLELPYIRQQDAAWLAKLLAPENMHLESYRNWILLVFGLIFQLSSLKEEEAKKKKKRKKKKKEKQNKKMKEAEAYRNKCRMSGSYLFHCTDFGLVNVSLFLSFPSNSFESISFFFLLSPIRNFKMSLLVGKPPFKLHSGFCLFVLMYFSGCVYSGERVQKLGTFRKFGAF